MKKRHPLKLLRQERMITQDELAKASGVSRRTIGSIERFDSPPTFDTRRALLKALAIDEKEHLDMFGPL